MVGSLYLGKRKAFCLKKEPILPGNGLMRVSRFAHFTDGEKRYAQKLWRKARIYLKSGEADRAYRHRKVWRVLVRGCSEGEAVTGSQTRDVG